MKKAIYFAVFVAAITVLAGCVGPPTEDKINVGQTREPAIPGQAGTQDAKSELKGIFSNPAEEYTMTYEVTLSAPGQGEVKKEETYYTKGEDRTRVDSFTEVDGENMPIRAYVLGKDIVMCGNDAGAWSCVKMSDHGNTTGDSREKEMEDLIDSGQVEKAADRIVAGVAARCYVLKLAASENVYCASDEGVILYSEMRSAGGQITIRQEATKYAPSADASDFLPPAEIGTIEDPMADKSYIPGTVVSVRTFQGTGDAVCTENGKPVIRLFSTTWCPHCKWIKDTFDQTMRKYVAEGKVIAYHWEVDTGDDTLTEAVEREVPQSELAIYKKYNPQGGVPTYVFGCKYSRVGNGYEMEKDLDAEKKEFEELIDELAS